MALSLIFWVLLILLALGGAYQHRDDWRGGGVGLLLFLLLLCLGWQAFGAPVQ